MTHPQHFFVAGVSFRKTNVRLRSKFSFTPGQCSFIYAAAHEDYFQHYFVLSTCNRTEIYGFAPCKYVAYSLLQQHASITPEELSRYVYAKEGIDAVSHFFGVACGMDSQIPGDYEIISQIKSAFHLAKQHRRTNGYLERLFNFAMQASKDVRTNTAFSSGTVSAVYAAAKTLSSDKTIRKVVILGAGNTGLQTVGYLKKLMPDVAITVVNRNAKKLNSAISMFKIQGAALENLADTLKDADAMVVATNANKPLVGKEHLIGTPVRYIFDLSVPQNVAEAVCKMEQVRYYNIDAISTLTDATIENRLSEIPKVKQIVATYVEKFSDWSLRHQYFTSASAGGHPLARKELASLFEQLKKT